MFINNESEMLEFDLHKLKTASSTGKKLFFLNSNVVFKKPLNSTDVAKQNAGNSGNYYIFFSLLKILQPSKVGFLNNIFTDFVNNNNDNIASRINCDYDCLVLILQDQLRENDSYGWNFPAKNLIAFLKKIKIPIFLSSIGANYYNEGKGISAEKFVKTQLSDSQKTFIKELCNLMPKIGTRGEWTKNIINIVAGEDVGIAVGCPTFYETKYTNPSSNDNIRNLTSFNDVLFTTPIPMISQSNSHVIIQDEKDLIDASFFSRRKYFKSVAHDYQQKAIAEGRIKFYLKINDWKRCASKYSYAFGNRVHGSLLALSVGCYPVLLNSDMRSLEMFSLLGLKRFSHPEMAKLFEKYNQKQQILNIIEAHIYSYDKLEENQQILFKTFTDYWSEITKLPINQDISPNPYDHTADSLSA